MPTKTAKRQPPTDLSRLFYRAPILLYRIGLGWVLGERFLLLHHTGRKSGLPRETVLEVVRHDEETDTYIVASGFGEKSDWFKNIQHNPQVEIEVGRRHLQVTAERLTPEEAEQELLDYAGRHPRALRTLAGYFGYDYSGTGDDIHALAQELPMIAFRPRQPAEVSDRTPQQRDLDKRKQIRAELEATRIAFHQLLDRLSDADWSRQSANPAWTNGELMYHMAFSLERLPPEIDWIHKGRPFPELPAVLFNPFNVVVTRIGARLATPESVTRKYDAGHAATLAALNRLEGDDWHKGATFPTVDQWLGGYRTIEWMLHYFSIHFAEHAAQITRAMAR